MASEEKQNGLKDGVKDAIDQILPPTISNWTPMM